MFGGYFPRIPRPLVEDLCFGYWLGSAGGFSVAVEAQWLAHCAIASSEAASKNCFFLTFKWHFMHSSLFCCKCEQIFQLWTDSWRNPPLPLLSSRLIGEPCPVTSGITANEHLVATMGRPLSLAGRSPILLQSFDGAPSSAVICLHWAAPVNSDWLSRRTWTGASLIGGQYFVWMVEETSPLTFCTPLHTGRLVFF